MGLNVYKLKTNYYNYLVNENIKNMAFKKDRLYIGIILDINNYKYFAPLTSKKTKHSNMHNSMDFIKIDNGKLGAINLNNMIPVDLNDIDMFDFKIYEKDDKKTIEYKNLVKKQFIWFAKNSEKIESKAKDLYNYMLNISNNNNETYKKLKERCCDFKLCENKLEKYLSKLNIHSIININVYKRITIT